MNKISILLIFFIASLLSAQVRNNSNQLYRLAQTYEQAGQYQKANEIYEKLYRQNPAVYSYFTGYARTLTALKKYDDAIKICEEKIRENPNDFNAYGLLGSVYYLKNQRDKAYAVWDEAVKKAGNNPNNYRTIANYAIQSRAMEKAIELLQKGKEKTAAKEIFNFDLASLYSLTMNYEAATKEYCEIIEKNPKQFYVIKNRINSLLASERANKTVVKTIEECYEKKETAKIAELLAYVYKESGEFNKAFDLIKLLDEKTSSNGKIIFSFAEESLRNNNFEIAATSYDYILENRPQAKFVEKAKLGLAKSLIKLTLRKTSNPDFWKPIKTRRKFDEEIFAKPISLLTELSETSSDLKLQAEANKILASLYFEKIRNYTKADSIFRAIIDSKIKPQSEAFVYSGRGKIALIEKKDLKTAEIFFNEILKLKKTGQNEKQEANFFIAQIHFWKGDFDKAAQLFDLFSSKKTSDYANDAIEKKLLISIFAKDSVNFSKFAKADFLIFTENFDSAKSVLLELANNNSLFMLNNLAKLKIAEILIAENKFSDAIKLLEELIENNEPEVSPDKALKYLGDVYFYGMKNSDKALEVYNKFLEKYPDSLYINIVRENIKSLKNW